jgi:hypothetical protein
MLPVSRQYKMYLSQGYLINACFIVEASAVIGVGWRKKWGDFTIMKTQAVDTQECTGRTLSTAIFRPGGR